MHSTLKIVRACLFHRLVVCTQAANARKQETISPVSSTPKADAVPSGNGGLARGYTNTIKPKTPARKVSPGMCQASPANISGNVSDTTPKPKPRVVRLSAPKAPESAVAMTGSNAAPAVESVQKDNRSTAGDPSRPASFAVGFAPTATSTSHFPVVSKHATNAIKCGGDGGSAEAYGVTGRGPADADRGRCKEGHREGDDGGGLGIARQYFAQQKRCAVRQGEVSRTNPPLPPDAEVLEVSRLCVVVCDCLFVHFDR